MQRVNRRTFFQGGLSLGTGLAAVALLGCAGDDEEDPTPGATESTGAATSTPGATYINQDLLSLNDPETPYPYVLPEPNVPPKQGGILHSAHQLPIDSFDTAQSTSTNWVLGPGFTTEKLLSYVGNAQLDPFKIQLAPQLALSWEVAPDGLTITYRLTDKAKYHNLAPANGRPLKAEDVSINYQRYATTGALQTRFNNVASMTAPDDRTFVLKLKGPQIDFLLDSGSRNQAIHARELFEGENRLAKGESIGSGPFMLEQYDRNLTTFKRNPDYWKYPVHLDGAEHRYIVDAATQLAAMRAGQLEYLTLANLQDTDALKKSNPDFLFTMRPLLNAPAMIGFNLTSPKFQDERIRQALTLAVDNEKISDVAFSGLGSWLPGMPWFMVFDEQPTGSELGPWFRHDLTEAKQLLDAAGVSNLSFECLVSSAVPASLTVGADTYRSLGIDMKTTVADATSFQNQYLGGKYQEALFGYVPGGAFGPDHYYYNHLSSNSPGNWWNIKDPQIDQWGIEQRAQLDPNERREILRKIWDRMLQKMYRIDYPGGPGFYAYQPYLRNLRWAAPLNSVMTGADEGSFAGPVWLDK